MNYKIFLHTIFIFIIGTTQKHYQDTHPDANIPEFVTLQAKYENLPSVSWSPEKLEAACADAMSNLSGDQSEGVDSSLVDFEVIAFMIVCYFRMFFFN
jgi:hypothetical protein